MKFLSREKLSKNMYIDNSGYLICKDAILARTGSQQYRHSELYQDSDDDSIIDIDRPENEVFDERTLASFENKPICDEHPDVDVTPDNYNELSIGFVRDVHKGYDNGQPVMMGTLVITDANAIEEIQSGKRQLSCGYDCDLRDGDNGMYQANIRGNHVALCEEGRAGIARIVDSKIEDAKIRVNTTKSQQELETIAKKYNVTVSRYGLMEYELNGSKKDCEKMITELHLTKDSIDDSYYTEAEKSDKEFVKNALSEMRYYERNWNYLSKEDKRNIQCTLPELKSRIKELEQINTNDSTDIKDDIEHEVKQIIIHKVKEGYTADEIFELLAKKYRNAVPVRIIADEYEKVTGTRFSYKYLMNEYGFHDSTNDSITNDYGIAKKIYVDLSSNDKTVIDSLLMSDKKTIQLEVGYNYVYLDRKNTSSMIFYYEVYDDESEATVENRIKRALRANHLSYKISYSDSTNVEDSSKSLQALSVIQKEGYDGFTNRNSGDKYGTLHIDWKYRKDTDRIIDLLTKKGFDVEYGDSQTELKIYDSTINDALVIDEHLIDKLNQSYHVTNAKGYDFVLLVDKAYCTDGNNWYTCTERVMSEYQGGKRQEGVVFRCATRTFDTTISYSKLVYCSVKHTQLSSDEVIDHLNGDHMDNRMSNWQVVSSKENAKRNLARQFARKQQVSQGYVSTKALTEMYGIEITNLLMKYNDYDKFKFGDEKMKDAKYSEQSFLVFDLCKRYNFYTNGSTSDYEKMLANCDTWSIGAIAQDISKHSVNQNDPYAPAKTDISPRNIARLIKEQAKVQNILFKDSIDDSTINDGHIAKGNLYDVLDEYLQWEGISGYTSEIIDVYNKKKAYIDGEWQKFGTGYDALEAYLNWEGILGYTTAIVDIIRTKKAYIDDSINDKSIVKGNGEVHFVYPGRNKVYVSVWNKNDLKWPQLEEISRKYKVQTDFEYGNIVLTTRVGNEDNLCKAFNEINPSYSVSALKAMLKDSTKYSSSKLDKATKIMKIAKLARLQK